MTKILFKTLLVSVAAVLLLTSCDKNNTEDNNNSFDVSTINITSPKAIITSADLADKKFVLNTYTTKLPDGVDSIQIITNEHPLYTKGVLKSQYVVDKDLDEANLAIYYYPNNRIALLAENNLNNIVYTYVIKADTKEFIDVFVVEKKEAAGSLIGKAPTVEIKIKSSAQNTMIASYDGQSYSAGKSEYVLQGWWSRFKGALKQLYDDWDDDPVGSLACTVTIALCAIGGAIWAIF